MVKYLRRDKKPSVFLRLSSNYLLFRQFESGRLYFNLFMNKLWELKLSFPNQLFIRGRPIFTSLTNIYDGISCEIISIYIYLCKNFLNIPLKNALKRSFSGILGLEFSGWEISAKMQIQLVVICMVWLCQDGFSGEDFYFLREIL